MEGKVWVMLSRIWRKLLLGGVVGPEGLNSGRMASSTVWALENRELLKSTPVKKALGLAILEEVEPVGEARWMGEAEGRELGTEGVGERRGLED